MLRLNKNLKHSRVAWLVLVNNRELFLTRSGSGCKYLYEKYKREHTLPVEISVRLFDKLKNSIIYVGDITKKHQPSLI